MRETLIKEIDDIKKRLAEIADEREDLPTESETRSEQLLAEEHRLENRLTELEDQIVEEEKGVAAEEVSKQTDITKPPKLPEDPEEE